MVKLLKCINCEMLYDPDKQSPFKDFNCCYHPREAINVGHTGPRGDYAELWTFPCCGKRVVGEISADGRDIRPSRSPGCVNSFHSTHTIKVFISYSRIDNAFVSCLENELQRRGYFLWRDVTDLTAAQNWEEMIDGAIEICSHFIIILSTKSVTSKEVKRELDRALSLKKLIIPILISDCELFSEISKINYIDWKNVNDSYSADFIYSSNFEKLREAFTLKANDER